ncbi:unnamed protein product [Lactuca saligna]|uniref:PGG domain-containing protein n=1 Tax=Lactuca saligna TaxID=75948 RepID=A0AA35ZP02_LACSI|nr:unnamed protein product [Lactuca saligna]
MDYGHSIHVTNTSRSINLPHRDLLEDIQEYNKTCRPLMKASFMGDWQAAKAIIDERQELVVFSITANQETLLHLAASAENTKQTQEFLQNLVNMLEMNDLKLEDLSSWNAFQIAVANGSMEMVDIMLQKNQALLSIPNMKNGFTLSISAFFGHHDLTRHLYQLSEGTIDTYMTTTDLNSFVHRCIRSEMFDITLKLLTRFPYKMTHLTYMIILDELARRPDSLNRPKQNMIRKMVDPFLVKLHMKKGPSENDDPALNLLKKVLNICTTFKLDDQLRILKGPSNSQNNYKHPSGVLFVAVEMGNTAFLIELFQVYPHLLTARNVNDDSIFHVAVMHRHLGIYNLLYEIGKRRLLSTTHTNAQGNTILHVVAQSSKEIQPQTTSGASLLMQRELLWFQDVEKMLPRALRENKNDNGQTAYQIFFDDNKDLISNGLKWTKDCMVTTTLIVTVAFAVAFTVPGGYNQETGFPIFLHETGFLVFVIADAISLFSSSTSLLVFLSILTSRYGQRDFLHSLPRKLMLGLLTLFISVVAMMVTFAASFFVLYNNGLKWVPIVISILAAIPVMLFALLQLPVWSDMFRSTFDSRYLFNPRRRRMLYNKSRV